MDSDQVVDTKTSFKIDSEQVADKNTSFKILKPVAKEREVSVGLKMVEIANSNRKFKEKTILIVGATGTGKTTFLNSMVNYLYNVKEGDDFRLKIVTQSEEGKEDGSSKTKHVSAYCFNNTLLPYRLVVVDTPGYGDTNGLAADKHTTGLIKDLFENRGDHGIDHLDAICIVVKASDSRLNAQQKHNFNSVLQLFGKDVAPNLFIIATFCDASDPPVKACLTAAGIDFSKFFKFNNSAFFEGFHGKNEMEKAFQTLYWTAGQTSFKSFFSELEVTRPVSLVLSAEVLQRRQQLEILVLDLHKSVKLGLCQLELLRQDALVQVRESRLVQEDISGNGIHTTTCMTCNFTCHSDCAYADNSDKGSCVAMNFFGSCKVCPQKCRWRMHKNAPYIYKTVEEIVTKTDEDLRKKYLKASDDKRSKEAMLTKLGLMFMNQQKQNCSAITNIRKTIQKLRVKLLYL